MKKIIGILIFVILIITPLLIVTSCEREYKLSDVETSWLWENINALAPELAATLPRDAMSFPLTPEFRDLIENHAQKLLNPLDAGTKGTTGKMYSIVHFDNGTGCGATGFFTVNGETCLSETPPSVPLPSSCGSESNGWTWTTTGCGGSLDGADFLINNCDVQ